MKDGDCVKGLPMLYYHFTRGNGGLKFWRRYGRWYWRWIWSRCGGGGYGKYSSGGAIGLYASSIIAWPVPCNDFASPSLTAESTYKSLPYVGCLPK